MAEMKADVELYKKWLEAEHIQLSEFSQDKDERLKQIETRINELRDTLFEAKARIAVQFEEFDKVSGRKGLSPFFRADREKLITDPNINVNFTPKDKKEKEPKAKKQSALEMLGLSVDDMKKEIADMKSGKKPITIVDATTEVKSIDDSKKNDLRERLAARKRLLEGGGSL